MATYRPTAAIQHDIDALRTQARQYRQGLLEGGEGFNPYDARLRELETEYDAAAEAEADALMAQWKQEEEARWTLELTQRRRAEWNAWVRSQGASIHPATVADRVKAQGWSMEELKRAITRHGL